MPILAKQYEGDGSVTMIDSEHIHPGDFQFVTSFKTLYSSMDKCIRGVRWKDAPASYYLNAIEETLRLEHNLRGGIYKPRKPKCFSVYCPKKRDIVSVSFRDRVFQRSLNDNVIFPKISKSFIYDNCACQPGKGTDFARNRLKCFLQRYYRKQGQGGYVLKCDIKSYYPNLSHKVVRDCFGKVIEGWSYEQALIVLDEQYSGEIGYNPGSQMVQIAGISVLNEVDHYIKEKLRIKHYVRYMDDFILIHHDKDYLLECQEKIRQILTKLDCSFNREKTGIRCLSDGITFLGFKFLLSKTGKVIMLISSDNVRRERRKLKRLVGKVLKGELPKNKVDDCYNAWKNHAAKGNSYHLIQRMNKYYSNLYKGGV